VRATRAELWGWITFQHGWHTSSVLRIEVWGHGSNKWKRKLGHDGHLGLRNLYVIERHNGPRRQEQIDAGNIEALECIHVENPVAVSQ